MKTSVIMVAVTVKHPDNTSLKDLTFEFDHDSVEVFRWDGSNLRYQPDIKVVGHETQDFEALHCDDEDDDHG